MQLEIISRAAGADNSKPALLFIHGAFHGAWCWDEHYLSFFSENGWDAHAVSLRGHGKSDGAEDMQNWTLSDYEDDIAQAIKEIAKPVILIGHSMGGVLAQRLWPKARGEVAGMVLFASSPLRPDPGVLLKLALRKPLSTIIGRITQDPERLRQVMSSFFWSPDISKDVQRRHFERLSLESRQAIAQVFERQAPEPVEGDERPVLVIAGREDWSIPLKQHKIFVDTYRADYEVCNGHHGMMIDPEWEDSAARILRWLEKF